MHKINKYCVLYNDVKKYKRVNDIYVRSNDIMKSSGTRCYVIPCKQNSSYTIKRSAKTLRNLIGVTREYPKVNTDLVVASCSLGTNLSIDVSTRDGNYIVIYYSINTKDDDKVRWTIKKSPKIINIFSGFELGDYDYQSGNAKDDNKRIRSVAEEKVLIDKGTYTIEFNAKVTIGIRLYDINGNFYRNLTQNDNSGILTFNVTKQSYIKLIALTTTLNTKAYLTREVD